MSDEIEDNDGSTADGDPGSGAGDESAFVAGEEKKPISKGTVALFLLISLAGSGVKWMFSRGGPSTASAATDPKAQQVIKQFMSDKDKNLAQMQKMLQDTDAVVKQFLSYPSVSQVPLEELKTNPFRAASAPAEQATAKRDEEREKRRKEEERLAVQKAVQDLQLQSVMTSGRTRACMINNTLYVEGQEVDQFTIEKISPNSVVVRKDVYRFELRMTR